MPPFKHSMTLDSVFTLVKRSRTRDDRPGAMAYLRQELPAGVNSLPLAAYAFMSGYINALSFITSAIWCGFMTGNSVMLGLALSRLSLGQRREDAFAINDAQAFTALVCFVIGIALARIGDLSIWAAPIVSDPEDKPRRSSVDWADSAPTRVGTPVPGKPRLVVTAAPSGSSTPSPTMLAPVPTNQSEAAKPTPTPTPASYAPARTRLWLLTGTLFQALLLVGSGVASMHDTSRWSSPSGFAALGLTSLSMGFQGVMAHRMGSGFGATVVLSSLWVELVGSPGGIRWKEYRGVRVYTILLFIVGGLVGGILRDPKVLGVSNSLFVGAGMRVVIAFGWLFVAA